MSKYAVLGFSGGLDTTYCAIKLRELGYEPICLTVDVGQGVNEEETRSRAGLIGIKDLRIIDARSDFADYFIAGAIKANALYQGVYPLATALSRPLISKLMVDVAKEVGTDVYAHGCTGKGNDQFRMEFAIRALHPGATILAPVRDDNLSRDEEFEYLRGKGVKIPIPESKPFSIDQNLWGRSVCAGTLEDVSAPVPEDAYEWTRALQETPNEPSCVEIEFEHGAPVAIDRSRMPLARIIEKLNEIGGAHGIGRIDHIEDRLVGIKSREIYECPAAIILLQAHGVVEGLTLSRQSLAFKTVVEKEYADLIYRGDWFSTHHFDLMSYLHQNQKLVSGKVLFKLYRGHCIVERRESASSLYKRDLVTYSLGSSFDQRDAVGMIKILSREHEISSATNRLNYMQESKRLSNQSDD